MSLVLNTNASGGGGYTLSNEFLDMYPDLKNKIIFSFGNGKGYSTTSITEGNYVAEVNGTRINERGTSIVAPECYTSVNGNDQGPTYFGYHQTYPNTTIQKRFGLPIKMIGGEIIGKEIIGGELKVFGYQSRRMSSGTFSQKVGLLHTDGTITYIGELLYTITTVSSSTASGTAFNVVRDNGGSFQSYPYTMTYSGGNMISGNGVVAQAGDMIICDLTLVISTAATSGDTSFGTGIFFGYNYTTNDNLRNAPLQISID